MESDAEARIWDLFEAIIWLKDVPADLVPSARVIGGAALRMDRLRYLRMRAKARYWVDPDRREAILRYNREHADQIREYHREWYDLNRERVRAAAAAYREANPDLVRQHDRDWRHSPAGREKRREQKRRARQRRTPEQRARDAERQRHRRHTTRPYDPARDRERQRAKTRRTVRAAALSLLSTADGLSAEVTADLIAERFDLRRSPRMTPPAP